jgi:pyruvate/2-oxoglutarate dehydrogenase complex dihydrolipoamide acyltransferase (E2) component
MSDFDEWMKRNLAARPANDHLRIAPLAKRIAEENQLDWTTLVGTGQDGLIIEKDVLMAVAKRKT